MDFDDNDEIGQSGHDIQAEEEDLRESLAGLSRLASERLPLEELLTQVATYAVRAIPGANGAGLTLLSRAGPTPSWRLPRLSAKSTTFSTRWTRAPASVPPVRSPSCQALSADPRWPRFGGRVARLGVHSVVLLPLITPDRVVGAMNVYAHDKNVFDERAAELGQIFAVPAAIAVQNAHVLAQTRRLANQLQSALEIRGVIDRAIGILMSRTGSTEHEAIERLRSMSQHEHRKLAEVASQIVDEAVARARARNRQSREPS